MLNEKLIKALDMIDGLRAEVTRLRPKMPRCQICDERMVKHSRVAAEGEEDWMEVTTIYYCASCAEINVADSEETH